MDPIRSLSSFSSSLPKIHLSLSKLKLRSAISFIALAILSGAFYIALKFTQSSASRPSRPSTPPVRSAPVGSSSKPEAATEPIQADKDEEMVPHDQSLKPILKPSEPSPTFNEETAKAAFRRELEESSVSFEIQDIEYDEAYSRYSVNILVPDQNVNKARILSAAKLLMLLLLASRSEVARTQLQSIYTAISSIDDGHEETPVTLGECCSSLVNLNGDGLITNLHPGLEVQDLVQMLNSYTTEDRGISIQQQFDLFFAAFSQSGECYANYFKAFRDCVEFKFAPYNEEANACKFYFTDIEIVEAEEFPKTPERPSSDPTIRLASVARKKGPMSPDGVVGEKDTPTKFKPRSLEKELPKTPPRK